MTNILPILDDLCAEYAAWNAAQGLSLGSADEHWNDETLTEAQRKWVRDFSRRWDIAADYEHDEWRKSRCRHRDDGRGRCIDCGDFI